MKEDTYLQDLWEGEESEDRPPQAWPGETDAPLHRLILADVLAPELARSLGETVSLARPAVGPRAWRKAPWCRH